MKVEVGKKYKTTNGYEVTIRFEEDSKFFGTYYSNSDLQIGSWTIGGVCPYDAKFNLVNPIPFKIHVPGLYETKIGNRVRILQVYEDYCIGFYLSDSKLLVWNRLGRTSATAVPIVRKVEEDG